MTDTTEYMQNILEALYSPTTTSSSVSLDFSPDDQLKFSSPDILQPQQQIFPTGPHNGEFISQHHHQHVLFDQQQLQYTSQQQHHSVPLAPQSSIQQPQHQQSHQQLVLEQQPVIYPQQHALPIESAPHHQHLTQHLHQHEVPIIPPPVQPQKQQQQPIQIQITPPPQPTQRAKHKRTNNGCYICRLRRIKCDLQKPTCNNCEKYGIECESPMKDKEKPAYLTDSFYRNLKLNEIKILKSPKKSR